MNLSCKISKNQLQAQNFVYFKFLSITKYNYSLGPPRLIVYSILIQADFCSGHGRILRYLFVGEWRLTNAEAPGDETLHIKPAGTTLLPTPRPHFRLIVLSLIQYNYEDWRRRLEHCLKTGCYRPIILCCISIIWHGRRSWRRKRKEEVIYWLSLWGDIEWEVIGSVHPKL